jgi:hypothetical protein
MRLLLPVLLLLSALPASASDIYFAQSSAGGNTGASCANARAVSSMAAGDYTAGNTLHLCGTLTAGFSILGSGSLGNVITIKWEPSARISVAFGGIININGAKAFLLFDGGFPCGPGTTCNAVENANMTGYASGQTGIIEATANGSGLANQNTATTAFAGCDGCHDIEFRNLIIRNLYQHTSTSDETNGADGGSWVWSCWSASVNGCVSGTLSIHDSFIHDTGNAIQIQKNSGNVVKIYNIDFARNNWALDYSGNGTRTLFFHDNICRDAKNWDTVGGASPDIFHHNCIHSYMNTSTDSLGTYIYNVKATGDWGACCSTSNFLFVETATPSNMFVFNNASIQSCNSNTEPPVTTRGQSSNVGITFYNNTFEGCGTTNANVEGTDYFGTGIVAENNANEGYGQFVVAGGTGTTFTTLDYNFYGAIGISGNAPWVLGSTNISTFATWKTDTGGDAHGGKLTSLNVNSSGVPQVGSGLIGVGVNLTSLCSGNLIPLCADINGNGRPTVGAWTVGALNPSVVVMPSSIIWP